MKDNKFEEELEELLNKYSKDNDCNTPDFILVKYLIGCLDIYEATMKANNVYRVKE